MFCPVCHSEYRRGIETCTTCAVELVTELRSGAAAEVDLEAAAQLPVAPETNLVPYCGFLSLDEARAARETLRAEGVRSEILIRDGAAGDPARPDEEFWLRVPASQFRVVEQVLGEHEEEPARPGAAGDDAVACSDCGKLVAEDETACPHCGAQFE